MAEPTHLDALIHLGTLRLSQGRADEAKALLRRAVAEAPESAEALGNLAAALQALGRHEEATVHYANALALRPNMLDARFGLAACLQASGRCEAAIAVRTARLVDKNLMQYQISTPWLPPPQTLRKPPPWRTFP